MRTRLSWCHNVGHGGPTLRIETQEGRTLQALEIQGLDIQGVVVVVETARNVPLGDLSLEEQANIRRAERLHAERTVKAQKPVLKKEK